MIFWICSRIFIFLQFCNFILTISSQITNNQFTWFKTWKKVFGNIKHFLSVFIQNFSGYSMLNGKKKWLFLEISRQVNWMLVIATSQRLSAPLWNTFSKVTLNLIREAWTKMPKFKNWKNQHKVVMYVIFNIAVSL